MLKLEFEGKFYFLVVKDVVFYEVDLELLDKINVDVCFFGYVYLDVKIFVM